MKSGRGGKSARRQLLGRSGGMPPQKICETRRSEIDSGTYLTLHNLQSTFELVLSFKITYLNSYK